MHSVSARPEFLRVIDDPLFDNLGVIGIIRLRKYPIGQHESIFAHNYVLDLTYCQQVCTGDSTALEHSVLSPLVYSELLYMAP